MTPPPTRSTPAPADPAPAAEATEASRDSLDAVEERRPPTGDRAIPLTTSQVVERLAADPDLPDDGETLGRIARLLELHVQMLFLPLRRRLKRAWSVLDPEAVDGHTAEERERAAHDVARHLDHLLARGNFRRLDWEDVHAALKATPLVGIGLSVRLEDFEELVIARRGDVQVAETITTWLGFKRRRVRVPGYRRVCLFCRFKSREDLAGAGRDKAGFVPGSTVLKLFRDVPTCDIETLLPNAEVCMRPVDRWMLGLPAAYGVVHFMIYKGGLAALAALAVLVGLRKAAPGDELAAFGACVTLGLLGALLVQQWNRFKSRKILFLQRLSEKLHFKKLDNGAGVLFHLLDEAREAEVKECLLAWAHLRRSAEPLSVAALDRRVEDWLGAQVGRPLDFDERDAHGKLLHLGLVEAGDGGRYLAVPPELALERLERGWTEAARAYEQRGVAAFELDDPATP